MTLLGIIFKKVSPKFCFFSFLWVFIFMLSFALLYCRSFIITLDILDIGIYFFVGWELLEREAQYTGLSVPISFKKWIVMEAKG